MTLLMVATFQVNQIPLESPAQESVMLRGRVVDTAPEYPHGGIGHVRILLFSPGDVESTVSNSKGYFYFLNLLPGSYSWAVIPEYECIISTRFQELQFDAGFEYEATIRLPEGCI